VQTGAAAGTVKKMGVANTTIRTFDGRRLLIPNRLIWGNIIENRSAEVVRRVDITVRVGYDEDINQVLQLLRAVVQDDERVLKTPEPDIFVLGLDESWMTVAVRPWVKTKDWWSLLTQLPRMVRLRFAEAGIEIPYPKSDVAIAGNRNPYEATVPKGAQSKGVPPSAPDLT
jgi:small conductance mechanosensitive channel